MNARNLLRQALESLELRCGTEAEERAELIPAIHAWLQTPEPQPIGKVVAYKQGYCEMTPVVHWRSPRPRIGSRIYAEAPGQ